eukprot:m.65912 g.65912  ORF g.65912 m.65912 type:complete len:359 (+) comp14016_c0_seq2:581-1657(+)
MVGRWGASPSEGHRTAAASPSCELLDVRAHAIESFQQWPIKRTNAKIWNCAPLRNHPRLRQRICGCFVIAQFLVVGRRGWRGRMLLHQLGLGPLLRQAQQHVASKSHALLHRLDSAAGPRAWISRRAMSPFSNPRNRVPSRLREMYYEHRPFAGVYIMMGVNTAVFCMWKYAELRVSSLRDFSLERWMYNNFTVSVEALESGRLWTAFTANISHNRTLHFAVNMFLLYNLGSWVAPALGPVGFVAFYAGASAAASAAHYLYHKRFRTTFARRFYEFRALGASGVVMACMTVYTAAFPFSTLSLYGLIPLPAIVATAGIVCWDFYHCFKGPSGIIANEMHVGGALFGLAVFLLKRRRFR